MAVVEFDQYTALPRKTFLALAVRAVQRVLPVFRHRVDAYASREWARRYTVSIDVALNAVMLSLTEPRVSAGTARPLSLLTPTIVSAKLHAGHVAAMVAAEATDLLVQAACSEFDWLALAKGTLEKAAFVVARVNQCEDPFRDSLNEDFAFLKAMHEIGSEDIVAVPEDFFRRCLWSPATGIPKNWSSVLRGWQEYLDDLGLTEISSRYDTLLHETPIDFRRLRGIVHTWLDDAERRKIAQPADGTGELRSPMNNRVFVVHGHDLGLKDSVARLIQQLGLEPIVLAKQPSQGLTIIEKLERHSDVFFAIALFTGDDLVAPQTSTKARSPRPRQNVVFELGYFVGRLGRGRTCWLHEDGVEIPSDLLGVVYIPIDEKGKWKYDLVAELKAAGFSVSKDNVA